MFCQFSSLKHQPDSGAIDGSRFFTEDVLAGLNGGFEVYRAEVRRRRENHIIYLGDRQELFIRIKPGEAVIITNCHAQLLKLLAAIVQSIRKDICQRNDFDVFLKGGRVGNNILSVVTG